MLPAANRGVGNNIGFPDVCLTPAGPAVVPVPYPNIAMNAMAAPFSPVVKVSMMNALNLGSKIPMTSGDEAGVAHPMIKQVGAYTMGNPIVFIDQMPGINLLCPTTGNNMNNPLGAVLVPSAVNVTYCRRTDAPAELDLTALRSLTASLNDEPPIGAVELHAGAVGVVAVARFTAELPAMVHDAVRRLEEQGAQGLGALVLDLRGNPGGDLDAAVRLAGEFLPGGTVIAQMVDGDGDSLVRCAPPGTPSAIPLVLLVDGGTASAAEIFAGCLQSEERALVVGEPTYGKETASSVINTPGGPRVLPDLVVLPEADRDAPLLAAIELARALQEPCP
jgi:carboxyl-terminal processing protease